MTAGQGQTATKSRQVDFGSYLHDVTARHTSVIPKVTDAYGELTGSEHMLLVDVDNDHLAVGSLDLENRIVQESLLRSEKLLEERSTDRAPEWPGISKLFGMSESTVHRWRPDELISVGHQHPLVILLELLEEVRPVGEPAGWRCRRYSEDYVVGVVDWYVELDYRDMPNLWDSRWRSIVQSDWKTVDEPYNERVFVETIDSDTLELQLEARTKQIINKPVEICVEFISDAGFSWSAIARLLDVQMGDIHKLCSGEQPVNEQVHNDLAKLVAFCKIVKEDHFVDHVASWMETWITGSYYTGLDIYAAGKVTELIQFAANHITEADLLRHVELPDDGFKQFEIFEAPDGERAFRLRRT